MSNQNTMHMEKQLSSMAPDVQTALASRRGLGIVVNGLGELIHVNDMASEHRRSIWGVLTSASRSLVNSQG